jgi:hypothetical protein
MGWITEKLPTDIVIEVVLFKKRVETYVSDIFCAAVSMCPDNVAMYYSVKALEDAPLEVKAAGGAVLDAAFRLGLEVKDEAVFRRSRNVFTDTRRVVYGEEHMRLAREALASMLRRCVVCVVDPFTFIEHFVRCVEWGGSTYYHVVLNLEKPLRISANPEGLLRIINHIMKLQRRVVVDEAEAETFYTLLETNATSSCT